mgnify:FL=1
MCREEVDQPTWLCFVDLNGCREQRRLIPGLADRGDDRSNVFPEAAAALADTTAEELFADAVVKPDCVGNLVGIDAVFLADGLDVVDETDLCGEEAVVGVFDHLGCPCVGLDDRAIGLVDEWFKDRIPDTATEHPL